MTTTGLLDALALMVLLAAELTYAACRWTRR